MMSLWRGERQGLVVKNRKERGVSTVIRIKHDRGNHKRDPGKDVVPAGNNYIRRTTDRSPCSSGQA